MAKKCLTKPIVTDKNGNQVTSKLFDDLISVLGNSGRDRAIEIYAAATDPEWVNSVSDKAKFDENGEITLHSLSKLANLNFNKQRELKTLNRQIGKGEYGFAEALQKAREFNQSEYGDDFLATVKLKSDEGDLNVYELSVVENTPENRAELERQVGNKKKIESVVDTLASYGVKADFVDNPGIYDGKYSTENADTVIDGLVSLIKVSKNSYNSDAVLIEEASHFAIAALHDSPSVKRLLELCKNKDFIRKLGIYEDENIYDFDNYYESAGRVLQKYLLEGKVNGFDMFMLKVKNAIFSLFSKMNRFKVTAAKSQAELYAQQVANDFFNGKASLETAMKNPMTLYSISETDASVNTFLATQNQIKRISNTLKNISKSLYDEFKAVNPYAVPQKLSDVTEKSRMEIANLVYEGYNAVINELNSVSSMIQLDIANTKIKNDDGTFNEEILNTDLAKHCLAYAELCNCLERLNSIATNNIIASKDNDLKIAFSNVVKLIQGFTSEQIVGNKNNILTNYALPITEYAFAKQFGTDSIQIRGKVNWGRIWHNANRIVNKNRVGLARSLARLESTDLTIGQVLTGVYGTDNMIERLLYMNLKLSDMGLSAVNNYIRISDGKINKIILSNWSHKLDTIEELAKKAGFSDDFSELLEVDDNGVVTGNFISERKIYKYYEFRRLIIENIKLKCEDHFTKYKDQFKTSASKQQYFEEAVLNDDNLKALENDSFVENEVEINGKKFIRRDLDLNYDKEWYIENGEVKSRTVEHVYKNGQYDKLSANQDKLNLLNAFKEYKEQIDRQLLSDGDYSHGVPMRIPQIELKSRFYLKRMYDKHKYASKNLLTEVGADYELGEEITPEELYAFDAPYDSYGDAYKRMPLYGIKRIENPSRDILSTMKLYTAMAVRYNVIRDEFDALSLAGRILNERRYIVDGSEQEAKFSDSDIDKAIDKALYNFDEKSKKIGSKFLTKAVNFWFLAKTLLLNAPSMVINSMSAVVMWMKNLSSPYYSPHEYLKNYMKVLATGHKRIPLLRSIGVHDKNIVNYVNNLFGKNIMYEDLRKSPWVKTLANEVPMVLYGKGDELAQQAIYITVLENKKVYSVDVDRINEILDNTGFDSYETAQAYVSSPKRKYLKKANMKDMFWGSHEDLSKLSKEERKKQKTSTFIKNGYVKEQKYALDYVVLSDFIKRIDNAIAENKETEADGELNPVFITLQDIITQLRQDGKDDMYLHALDNYLIDIHEGFGYGNLKGLEKIRNEINDVIDEISVTEKDVMDVVDNITAESSEVQGLYYAGAKAKISEYVEFKGMALLMMFAVGYFNKNFNSNYNWLTKQYEVSKGSAILYSVLRMFLGASKNAVYDKDYGQYRKMKLNEWFTVLSLNTPIFNAIIKKSPTMMSTLKSLGYTEQMIRRMWQWGDDLLGIILWNLIAGLFVERNPEASSTALSAGDKKRLTAIYSRKALWKFGSVNELHMNPFEKFLNNPHSNHIAFDAITKPEFNDKLVINKEEKVVDLAERRFGKTSSIYKILADNTGENILEELDKISEMLYDYADNLNSGKYETPEAAIGAACEALGYDKSLGEQFIEAMSGTSDANKVKIKEGGANDYMSYNEYLETYDQPNNQESRDEYDEYVKQGSSLVVRTFDSNDPFSMYVLADNIRALTLKGVKYDKDSADYKIAGILRYLTGRVASETISSGSMLYNLVDISTIGLIDKGTMSAIVDLINLTNTASNIGAKNTKAAIRKRWHDYMLHKIFMESDDAGYFFPGDPDDMSSAEKEYRTGAEVRDGFQVYSAYDNFQRLGK